MLPVEQIETVSIKAYGRLHLGFLDMNGNLGRRFGGLGLCLEDIATHLTVKKSADVTVHGASNDGVKEYLMQGLDALKIKDGVDLTIHEQIPAHAGLGSGTQLALALGTAITRLYGLQHSAREIALFMGRGARSGIGIGAFTLGGILIDGGRGVETAVPPVIYQRNFPEQWRVLLVFDRSIKGKHGEHEKKIFAELPLMSEEISAHICRLVLMQIMPALEEQDCVTFGIGLSAIQKIIGQYFTTAQRGYYSSQKVAESLYWLSDHGATGIGQSSWGPTGFAIYANESEVTQALQAIKKDRQAVKGLDFCLCKARNTMADIVINGQLIEDTTL